MPFDYSIAVRDLVEFVDKLGDLNYAGNGAAPQPQVAIEAHQKYQCSINDPYYKSEVFLKYVVEDEDIKLNVQGRADGIYTDEKNLVVEEIKTTYKDPYDCLDDIPSTHWGQVKCYGFMYLFQEDLVDVTLRLTYLQVPTKKTAKKDIIYTRKQLEKYFKSITKYYLRWIRLMNDHKDARTRTIKKMSFPFDDYRPGQRQMAVKVYSTIRESKDVLIGAPTGIGKTVSTVFPAIKAMGEGLTSKIFYLTARGTGRNLPDNIIQIMIEQGLEISSIMITAKEKTCLSSGSECTAEDCEYASGYYTRLKQHRFEIIRNWHFNIEKITELCEKFKLCPFELSLELVTWTDIVIGDFNYVFDPQAFLQRCFAFGKTDYTLLIDESHNLVNRARDMYSTVIEKRKFVDLKKEIDKDIPQLTKVLNSINRKFNKELKEGKEQGPVWHNSELPEAFMNDCQRGVEVIQDWLTQNIKKPYKEKLMEVFFAMITFQKIALEYGENYVTIREQFGKNLVLKMYCVDPAPNIRTRLELVKTAVFFSATLLPVNYFRKLFGLEETTESLLLPSPFPKENLSLHIADRISTKYKNRAQSSAVLISTLHSFIENNQGNILVFFPSYEYMHQIYDVFLEQIYTREIIIQSKKMSDDERNDFLMKFELGTGIVAFAVLGGIFGESIDLIGDKLSGAVIVGVGLPSICYENDIIKDYFNELHGNGFDFAYLYPGFNRVLQAVGRVIRSETDKGQVLLIDERFRNWGYRKLFPGHWNPRYVGLYT